MKKDTLETPSRKGLIEILERRLRFEKVISEVSSYLASISGTEFDKGIQFSLKAIGQFMNADRSLFFLYEKKQATVSCCGEWRKSGIKSIIKNFQDVPIKDWNWMWEKIIHQQVVEIPNINALPKAANKIQINFRKLKIKSVIAVRLNIQNEILGFLAFESLRTFREWSEDDTRLLISLSQILARAYLRKELIVELQQTSHKLQMALLQIIDVISKAIEMRDPYTAGHQQRTAILAQAIAIEMGLSEDQVKGIEFGGLLHDVGKIYIPAEILGRPGKLTDLEMQMIREHPQAGYNLLKNITFPWPIANIALEHHERINGTGYPNKIKGENILLESRIISVADVVEAMSSHRPYRPAHSLKEALNEISKYKGKLYDPKVVDACLNIFKKGFKFKSYVEFSRNSISGWLDTI